MVEDSGREGDQPQGEWAEKERLLTGFHRIGRTVLEVLDIDQILDRLATQIIEAGMFRSLMVALVHEEGRWVEVVRNYVCIREMGSEAAQVTPGMSVQTSDHVILWRGGRNRVTNKKITGTTYSLDDDNITPTVARTGQMAVIEEWSPQFDQNAGDPAGRKGKVAYFIPVKKGEQVLAVLATGSELADKEETLRRIQAMQPLLDYVAIALEHARLYAQIQREMAERRQADEKLREEYRLGEGENAVRLRIASMTRPEDLFRVVEEISGQLRLLGVEHDSATLQIANPEGTDFVSVGEKPDDRPALWEKVMGLSWGELTDHSQVFPWVLEVWQRGRSLYQPCLPPSYGQMAGYSLIDVPFSRGTLAINRRQSHAFDAAKAIPILERFARVLSDGFQRFEDIVRRRQAEEALQESEQRFRELFAHMSSGVAVYEALDNGADFVFQDLNQAGERISRRARAEVLGRRIAEAFPGVEKIGLLEVLRRVWRTGEPERHAVSLYQDERLKQWVENDVYKLPSGQVVAVYDDVTDHRRIEQELVRLERLRAVGELSAGISHNLNNILTCVLGPAQLLKRLSADPKVLQEADEIIAAATRARDLVHRLHLSVRGMEEDLQPVRVDAVVREVVQATRPRWKDQPEARGIAVEVLAELEEGALIRGTPTGLYDALTNLILNAVEAMPRGGSIRIRAKRVEEEVQLAVTDTGTGMDEETQKRLFEPFFTTKMSVGTGLGLAMAYRTVTGWGGDISVASAPGAGATFTLCLPVWQGAVVAAQKMPQMRQSRRGRLLIVEDDEQLRMMLARVLRGKHEVEIVEKGRDALERFEPDRFDTVLFDLGMPGIPGDQVAQEIRRLDPAVATVLITGWMLEADDPRLAVFDFRLQKPFTDLDLVEEVVGRAVALRHSRR